MRQIRRGSAMVMCLGVLAMMAVLAATFLTFTRLNTDATAARGYTIRMDLLANGVLQQIRVLLAKDLEKTSERFDHPRFDPWLAGLLPDANNVYRYVSRLDQADNAWENSTGGRPPEQINVGTNPTAGVFSMLMLPDVQGRLTVPTGRMDPASPYYVDSDGDGRADALLTGLAIGNNNNSGGVVFHDGSAAVVAVRIIDNAHFNARHHAKWSPYVTTQLWRNQYDDYTTGIAEWRRSIDPSTGQVVGPRPRLPNVNLRGLRLDPVGQNGPQFDTGFDRMLHSDNFYFLSAFMPGRTTFNFPFNVSLLNSSSATNRPDLCPPPFNFEDEIALRVPGSDGSMSKYISAAAGWPITFAPVAGNARRVLVSGVTRERTLRWMNSPTGTILATPFDLRKILISQTTADPARLGTLMNYMNQNNVLPNANVRAQFLANLSEYVRRPATFGAPMQYTIGGISVYGVCRQPFLTEMIRDGGTPGNVPQGQSRDFSTVRVGVELYNPYPDPISLASYSLEFRSEATATAPFIPAAQGQNNPIVFSLAPIVQINAFSSIWLSTDSVAPYQLPTVAPDDVRRSGPRLVVELKSTISNAGGQLIMDRIDTRPGGLASGVMNSVGGGGRPIDWSDWDGTGLAGQDLTNFNLTVNNNPMWQVPATTMNGSNGTPNCVWGSARSGIYRPQGPPNENAAWPPQTALGGNVYPKAAPATTTNLWRGYRTTASSANALNIVSLTDTTGAQSTPGAVNSAQIAPGQYGNDVVTGGGFGEPFIFGSPVFLPCRGVDTFFGAKFVNLGELAHVLTVGNTPNGPFTDNIAAASQAARTGANNYMPGVAVNNNWAWVDFERQFKFDILGSNAGGQYNAAIFNFVSLYMGAGTNSFAAADFSPWTGLLDDTSEDLLPSGAQAHPLYREGRININTAPDVVLANLPWPRVARMNGVGTPAPNILFAQALTSPPGGMFPNGGYLNQLAPPGGLDPFFAEPADVFVFSRAWGALAGVNNAGQPLVGWDALMYTNTSDNTGAPTSYGNLIPKHADFKINPHAVAYTLPLPSTSVQQAYPLPNGGGGAGAQRDYAEYGYAAGLHQRDALWAPMTNVLSTRADVFTAFIMVKLVRPTPGVPQISSGGQQFEDLGEVRLVAIIDRSSTRIISNPGAPNDGKVDMSNPAYLPRVLSRQFMEQF
jgi:hypothetical protein